MVSAYPQYLGSRLIPPKPTAIEVVSYYSAYIRSQHSSLGRVKQQTPGLQVPSAGAGDLDGEYRSSARSTFSLRDPVVGFRQPGLEYRPSP